MDAAATGIMGRVSDGLPATSPDGRPVHLAQVNVARLRASLDAPEMRGFAAALDPVNRLADRSPGFVWRLPAAHGQAVPAAAGAGPRALVNVSVWESYEALHAYVYRSAHARYLRDRARWFEPAAQPSAALWWVAAGSRPTAEEAQRRLAYLRRYGPSPSAFTLRRRFDARGRPVSRDRRRATPLPTA
jgi:hypothetical protein